MRWPLTRSPVAYTGFTQVIYPNSQVFKVDLVKRPGNTPNLMCQDPRAPLSSVGLGN